MNPQEFLAEPVAWMYHGIHFDGTLHDNPKLVWKPEYMDLMSANKGAVATPLYAHPQPSEEPVSVVVERGHVWIKRGVQSFKLAYEADTDEEREWYAERLRSALRERLGETK